MVDFVERFFKLTLDNVYRFACSLLAAVTVFAIAPLEGLSQLLNWLAVPSTWLIPVSHWVAERQEAVGVVAALTLIVAVLASTNDWGSRSGSTALLSIVVLVQVGQGTRLLTTALVVLAGLAITTGITAFFARRLGLLTPGWAEVAGERP